MIFNMTYKLSIILGLMLALAGCGAGGTSTNGTSTTAAPPASVAPHAQAPSPIFSASTLSTLTNSTTVAVAVSGSTTYTVNSSLDPNTLKNAQNLFIADVSNRSAPVVLGQLDLCANTPSGQPCTSSFKAIAVANQYAVVVGNQLQMVDVSVPASPVLHGTLALSGVATGVTVVGSTAYVAAGAQGLVIVNIADPTHPVVLGHTLFAAYGVRVIGSTAYVAAGSGLQIVDMSNPAAPLQVGAVIFNTPYAAATDVEIVGTIAYVAAGIGGVQAVDISNPSNPSVMTMTTIVGYPQRLAIQNNVLYVADGAGGLALVDIPSPGVLAVRTRVATNSGTGEAVGLAVSGGVAYVAYGSDGLVLMDSTATQDPEIQAFLPLVGAGRMASSGSALYVSTCSYGVTGPLQVVNIADSVHPALSGTIPVQGCVFDVKVAGPTAFVANDLGLRTFDVASGSVLSTTISVSGGPAVGVAVSGTTAYVADRDGFMVANVSNPSSPSLIGGISTKKDAWGIVADGSLVYVAQGQDGVGIFNISNPGNPTVLNSFTPSPVTAFAANLIKIGNLLYIADGSAGLAIVDVANPAAPKVLAVTGNADDNAQNVAMDGSIAYVANGYGGVKVFDISDPTKPTVMGHVRTVGYAADVHVVGSYVYVSDVIGVSVFHAF